MMLVQDVLVLGMAFINKSRMPLQLGPIFTRCVDLFTRRELGDLT